MSVIATSPYSTATGSGAATSFPFAFACRNIADVVVYVNGAIVNAGITITLGGDFNSGTVVFATAPANAAAIIIASNPTFEQQVSFESAGAYNPSTVDVALDEAAIRDIHLNGLLERAPLAPIGETLGALPAKASRAGTYFAFDANGDPVESSGTGADAGLRTDLAATTGAGLVAFNDALIYGDGTVGAQIKSQRVISDLATFVSGTGSAWPFQDLFHDRVEYGQDTAPISPNAGAANFTTPFYRGMYLGTGHIGGGQTGFFLLHVNGTPNASSANKNYTPLQSVGSAEVSLGGTGLSMGTAKGAVFGQSSIAILYSGAVDILNVTGGEINVQVSAGATVADKTGLQIVQMPDDAVSGSIYDAALMFSNQSGAVGWTSLLTVSGANGQAPLKSTGSVFRCLDNPTFANGFDLSGATVTGSAFKSTGFGVDGSGRASLTVRGNFANDAAAATGSVPIGELYRNGSAVQIRVA